jgi:hypothetical protein
MNLDWHFMLLVLSILCRGSPLCVNSLVVLMPCVDHVAITSKSCRGHQFCGGYRLLLFWGSTGNHLHNAELEADLLMPLVGCWLRWPGDCGRSWLSALLLEILLGVLALHWDSLDGVCCSVKPDEARELIWLVPTKVFTDLLLSLVTLWLPEHTAQTPELHCSNATC